MFWRNGKRKDADVEEVNIHVSPRGDFRVDAAEVFATESVKKLLEQTSKIKTVYSVRKGSQDHSQETRQPNDAN